MFPPWANKTHSINVTFASNEYAPIVTKEEWFEAGISSITVFSVYLLLTVVQKCVILKRAILGVDADWRAGERIAHDGLHAVCGEQRIG
jgi:hypothetical protein